MPLDRCTNIEGLPLPIKKAATISRLLVWKSFCSAYASKRLCYSCVGVGTNTSRPSSSSPSRRTAKGQGNDHRGRKATWLEPQQLLIWRGQVLQPGVGGGRKLRTRLLYRQQGARHRGITKRGPPLAAVPQPRQRGGPKPEASVPAVAPPRPPGEAWQAGLHRLQHSRRAHRVIVEI